VLRLVSWNINSVSPNRTERATAAMDHLRKRFDKQFTPSPTSSQPQLPLSPLVIMLQGVHKDSLTAILAHNWVQNNFVISTIVAPDPARQGHFNLLLVSRGLKTLTSGGDSEGWFRIRLGNHPDDYALFVDIPIASSSRKQGSASVERKAEEGMEVLRLGTINLGPPPREGQDRRPLKLAEVAARLRASLPAGTGGVRIVGGVVGGDMNSLCARDVTRHQAGDVILRDVWEEPASPNYQYDSTSSFPGLGETAKDRTYGRERGHTYGYQSSCKCKAKRSDKFFCHGGRLEMHAIYGAQDWSGKVGRVGIAVKADGKHKKYVWVSDHFGICVGVRVL
jgi:hypothetical protein